MTLFGAFGTHVDRHPRGLGHRLVPMLLLYRRVVFGKLEKDDLRALLDMTPREIVFAPLVILVIWMGNQRMPSSISPCRLTRCWCLLWKPTRGPPRGFTVSLERV